MLTRKALYDGLPVAAIVSATAVLVVGKGGLFESARALALLIVALSFLVAACAKLWSGAEAEPRGWVSRWLLMWGVLSLYLLLQHAALYFWAPPPINLSSLVSSGRLVGPHGAINFSPRPANALGYWSLFTLYWVVAYWVASMPRRQLKLLITAVVAVVLLTASYGLIAYIGRHQTVLGLWIIEHSVGGTSHDVVRGTFSNRNHMAGLIAVSWPIAIALLLYGVSGSQSVKSGEAKFFLAAIFSIVLALALLNTRSRLGTVSALVGLTTYYLIAKLQAKGTLSVLQKFWLWVAAVSTLGLSMAFGLVPLLDRYTALLLGEAGERWQVWRTLFQAPANVWLIGVGAGGFEDVFKLLQPVSIYQSYLQAHNDWLQFVFEFGLLGCLLTAVAAVFWFRQIKPRTLTQLQAGACGGIAAIMLHSLGDFNLQIPGVAILFWIAVGVAVNRHLATTSRRRRA